MNRLRSFRGPGLAWMPRTLRRREYWAMVGRFALLGPLVGGLPYVWMVFTIPFAYLFGLVPAAIAGALYAAWRVPFSPRPPSPLSRATVSAICGAFGCAITALAVSPANPAAALLMLSAHGVPAAVILALLPWRAKRPVARNFAPEKSADDIDGAQGLACRMHG